MTATRDDLTAAMPSTADHVLSVIETDHQQLIVQRAIVNNEDNP